MPLDPVRVSVLGALVPVSVGALVPAPVSAVLPVPVRALFRVSTPVLSAACNLASTVVVRTL